MLTALTALSIDALLPAFGAIARALVIENTNNTQLIITIFVFGMVFGEIIFGPLSDATGRKKAILIGLTVYVCGTLIALFANSLETLLLARLIQGIGVAGPKIGTRALIRDLFEGAVMARVMSIIFSVLILVPMISPALAQIVLIFAGWRMIFVCYLIIGLTLAIWLSLRQPETHPPEKRVPIVPQTLIANMALIFKHRKVMAYTLCAGLIFGAQLLYISLAHSMFVDLYDTGTKFPLFFAFVAAGVGAGTLSNAQLVQKFGMQVMIRSALFGFTALSVVFLILTLIYNGVPPFTIFMGFCILAFYPIGIVFGNVNALAMQSLARVAGLGSSVIASVSSIVAVAVSTIFGRAYDQSLVPLALMFVFAGVISFALVRYVGKLDDTPI